MVTLPPETEAAIDRINTAHQSLMDRLAEVEADHDAALIEYTERAEASATRRRAEYRAYLCMMTDHGCECVALGFDEWSQVRA